MYHNGLIQLYTPMLHIVLDRWELGFFSHILAQSQIFYSWKNFEYHFQYNQEFVADVTQIKLVRVRQLNQSSLSNAQVPEKICFVFKYLFLFAYSWN